MYIITETEMKQNFHSSYFFWDFSEILFIYLFIDLLIYLFIYSFVYLFLAGVLF